MKRPTQLSIVFSASVLALVLAPVSLATVCVVPDSGGTADMPPATGTATCTQGYVSPNEFHEIIDGLPAGATIEIGPEHSEFILRSGGPGGSLGGETEEFDSILQLQLTGTGTLAGYNRTIALQLLCTTDIGPRTPGDAVQTFPNEMVSLQGQLPPGDPDFDTLVFRAGSAFGLPSPGQTTLTRLGPPGSDFNVDSFFDITYEIDFVGNPSGPLGGGTGTTSGTVQMQAGEATQATPGSSRLGLIIGGIALIVLLSGVMFLRRPRIA